MVGNISSDEIRQGLTDVLDEMNIPLESIDMQAFTKSLVSLVNHMSLGVRINANTSIFAPNIKTSNLYGEVLAKTIEKWFPDCCAVTRESSIYNWTNWKEKEKAFKLLLVKDCEAQSMDKLYATLSEYEKNGWNPTVILCSTEKVFEKMRRYDKNEYRLFYSLCGYKIIVSQ